MTAMGSGNGSVLDIGALLADRMLTITGADDLQACARRVNPSTGGLVVTGDKKPAGLTALSTVYPGLPVFREPVSASQHIATAAQPFQLGGDGELFELDLNDVMEGQRAGGAAGAITPSGFFPPAAADAMKAAIEQANNLDRNDFMLWLPVAWTWAREPDLTQFIAIGKRSRHPIALTFADSTDPLGHAGVPMGLRKILAEVPRVVPWRVDLAGIDALAHGAIATAIGMLPSTRHITEPGKNGHAMKPGEKDPHILMPDLLRFVRASRMRDEWFASSPAPDCFCAVCDGRPLDRFNGTPGSRLEGHLHNLVELTDLHTQLLQAGQARGLWWHDRLDDARAAHQALAARVSVKTDFPKVLDVWSKN